MPSTVFKRGRLGGQLRATTDPALAASMVATSAAVIAYLVYLANEEAKKFKRDNPDLMASLRK